MACHNPLQAWRPRKGRQLVFNKNEGWKDRSVEIPCGQCIGCRLDRSLMWAVRISNELTLHEQASFLTLTYKDLPPNNSINKEDLQAFFKRLRFHLERKKSVTTPVASTVQKLSGLIITSVFSVGSLKTRKRTKPPKTDILSGLPNLSKTSGATASVSLANLPSRQPHTRLVM